MYEYAQYSSMFVVPVLVIIILLMVIHEIKKEKKRDLQKKNEHLFELKRQLDLATKDWRDSVSQTHELKVNPRENESPEILRSYIRSMRRSSRGVRRFVTSQTSTYPDTSNRRMH